MARTEEKVIVRRSYCFITVYFTSLLMVFHPAHHLKVMYGMVFGIIVLLFTTFAPIANTFMDNVFQSADAAKSGKCTVENIEFEDIEQLPPFLAKDVITLDGARGDYDIGLDYYVVDDNGLVHYLMDPNAKNPPGKTKLVENEIITFEIESNSHDFVLAYLVDKRISDCDIVATPFNFPADKKVDLDVIDISQISVFSDFIVSAQVPDASEVDSNFTKLVVVYTESADTWVLYIVPRNVIVLEEGN